VQVELITSVDISLAFSYDASARTAKIVNGGSGLPTRDLYILGSKATEYAACLGMQLQSPASFQGDLPATLDYALANGIAGFTKLSISLGTADPFDVMDRLDLPGWPSEIEVQSTTLTVDLDPRSGAVTYMQLRQVCGCRKWYARGPAAVGRSTNPEQQSCLHDCVQVASVANLWLSGVPVVTPFACSPTAAATPLAMASLPVGGAAVQPQSESNGRSGDSLTFKVGFMARHLAPVRRGALAGACAGLARLSRVLGLSLQGSMASCHDHVQCRW
jgi:hypothetical protein